MAEPFSIISLVVSTAKKINTARNFVETICRAPRSVAALSSNLAEIENLLRQLGVISSGGHADGLGLQDILAGPIAKCESVSNELHTLVDPWIKTNGEMKVWNRFAFGFKEGDVLLLSTKMESCKQNLTLALTIANNLTGLKNGRGLRRIQHRMGIETSSIANEDIQERAHEKFEQWNMETER